MLCRPLTLALAALLLAAFPPAASAAPASQKSTWNYDGGLMIITDGSIASGPCFRLTGRVTAPTFFDNLRREDSKLGTIFHRGHDIVTEFPDKLHVSFLLYDLPCDYSLRQTGSRLLLTRAMVSGLRLSFYWKNGLKLRPAAGVVPGRYETRRIVADRVDPAVAAVHRPHRAIADEGERNGRAQRPDAGQQPVDGRDELALR